LKLKQWKISTIFTNYYTKEHQQATVNVYFFSFFPADSFRLLNSAIAIKGQLSAFKFHLLQLTNNDINPPLANQRTIFYAYSKLKNGQL